MSTYLLLKERNPQYWIKPSKPQLIGYFAEPRFRSDKTTFCDEQNALGSLKYYNKHTDLNETNSFTTLKNIAQIFGRDDTESLIKPLANWISNHSEMAEVKRTKFVIDRGSLTTILNTPLSPTGCEWNMLVKFRKETFYLIMNKKNRPSEYFACLEAVNNCLFNDMPDGHTLVTVGKDDLFFNEVYKIQVGGKTIIYSAEIPGVHCDNVVSNLEELKAVTHVDIDICWETNGKLPGCRRCCNLWTKAALTSADHVFVAHPTHKGYHGPNGQVVLMNNCTIQKTTIDNLIATQNEGRDTFKAPESAWNFLDDLLTFVERQVSRDAETSPTSCYEFKLEKGSAVSCKKTIGNA